MVGLLGACLDSGSNLESGAFFFWEVLVLKGLGSYGGYFLGGSEGLRLNGVTSYFFRS